MSGDVVPQKPEPTLAWSTTPRVLVVEDDQVCRNLCTKYTQDYGCSVDLAFDGASAVNKMNIEKFDLVFMVRAVSPSLAHSRFDHYQQDITMPKLDGCSATSMIRQFNRATPIVAVTPNTKPSQVMGYFTAGMNDVLGKPFAKAEVIEILEVCCILILTLLLVLIGCSDRNTFRILNQHQRGRPPRVTSSTRRWTSHQAFPPTCR